ncbi:unnamed protein product [Trichobilharzia szidati]|nr:unnamed protein product [Trichobilharzia szidati]
MGQILFTDVKNGIMYQPEEYGPYTEEHSLHQCVQEENDAYSAKLKTQEKLDCDVFRPSIHGGDPQNLEYNREFATLKSKIIDSYKQKYLYGKTILMKKIHETAIKRLKRKIYLLSRMKFPHFIFQN